MTNWHPLINIFLEICMANEENMGFLYGPLYLSNSLSQVNIGIREIDISGKVGFIACNLLKFTFQKTVEKCVRYASLHFSRCGRSVGVRSTRALKTLQLTSICSEM